MRVTLMAALMVALISCSNGEKKESESAGEIMKKYTDTLAAAPEKARKTAEKSDERNSSIEKTMKELDR